jgi:hypothetical protein
MTIRTLPRTVGSGRDRGRKEGEASRLAAHLPPLRAGHERRSLRLGVPKVRRSLGVIGCTDEQQ